MNINDIRIGRYILKGKRVFPEADLMTWARFFSFKNRRIKRTIIGLDKKGLRKAVVSTVFLGLDHSFGFGPPLLFETMIFDPSDECGCWRYANYREALKGHQHAIKEATIFKFCKKNINEEER